ncbi:MAG: hypothetical protein Q7R81_06940 [Candidatus Peregrinibacteria bacterium]|nr:hypothetical protein [Candidatus Peregrinibacteria bacterium]
MAFTSPAPYSDSPDKHSLRVRTQADDDAWTIERIQKGTVIPGTWLMRFVEGARTKGFGRVELELVGLKNPETSVSEWIAALRKKGYTFEDVFPQRVEEAERLGVYATANIYRVQREQCYALFGLPIPQSEK